MFRWPQNGRSRITESSNLSGEEFFLPSTIASMMIGAFSSEFRIQITDLMQLPGLKKQKW